MAHSILASELPLRVLDHASSMMAYWDADLVCKYANRVYQTWFGVAGDRLIGTRLPDLLGPELYRLNEPFITGALRGIPQVFERSIPGPDGIVRHSIARYHPDMVDGAVAGFVAEVTDVSALRELASKLQAQVALKERAVAALRKKDQALEAAQRLGMIGSWEWEPDSDITIWSPELYRLFGYDPTHLAPGYGEHVQLFAPASRERLRAAVDAAVAHGRSYVLQLDYRGPDGTRRWFEVRGEVERSASGAVIGLRGTAQDVTQSHALMGALREQSERLELALDAAQLGICTWCVQDETVVWENQRGRDIMGLPLEDGGAPRALALAEVFHPEDLETIRLALSGATPAHPRFSFKARFYRRTDGRLCWLECFGKLLEDGDGKAILIGTVADISEQVMAKEALFQSLREVTDADARKTHLFSELAHELRNCLAPISLGVQTLNRNPNTEASLKIRQSMARQVDHMARLVGDLYDLRRLQSGQLMVHKRPLSLNAVLAGAAEMCLPAIRMGRHSLSLDLPSAELTMMGDSVRLTQVLTNLINNAAKFTPSEGNIALSLRADGMHAVIVVRDDGIGIACEALERIWELYARVETHGNQASEGLGIGLYVVRQLVELHDGTIAVASEGSGKGCTFTIRLPLGMA